MRMIGRPVFLALVLLAGAGGLASNSYAQATSVVVLQPSQRVYTSPEGRYELRGDGTASSPYYWVWIPTGVQAVPAPPPLPSIVQPSQPAYGPPPPPTIVQPSQRVFTYPEGRYELRGDGTASSPHYWVWIPAGTMSQILALRYQPDLRSVEGQVESIGLWGTSIMLGGRNFEFPDSFAKANQPAVGQQVMVTYYVAQDGRNIVRSLDPISARSQGPPWTLQQAGNAGPATHTSPCRRAYHILFTSSLAPSSFSGRPMSIQYRPSTLQATMHSPSPASRG